MDSPSTLILRFSDVEGPTIDLHRELLAQNGEVLWGWWRKDHEPQRLDALHAVAERLPETIGLVNRREGKFYRAGCIEIAAASEGQTLESPDRTLTPDYYQDERLPAWLRLVEIEEVSLEEWNEIFGDVGVPAGDRTLFTVERTAKETAELEASAEVQVFEQAAPGDSILHITDLHFGEDHGFPLSARQNQRKRPMRERIVRRVEEIGEQIGVIVVSGDLTTGSNFHVLNSVARPEIKQLADDLGVGCEHVVIVPGNHDIPLSTASPEATRHYRHEQGFRRFIRAFFDDEERELEAIYCYETPSGLRLNFAALNSVRMIHQETRHYGWVGPRASFVMDEMIKIHGGSSTVDLAAAGVINFAVLHHHVVSGPLTANPPAGPVSVTLDAGNLIADFQRASVHVALHGHQHVPFLATVARPRWVGLEGWDGYKRPLTLIGGGSAGADLVRLDDEMHDNTFGIYRPRRGAIDIEMEQFNGGMAAYPFLRTTIEF